MSLERFIKPPVDLANRPIVSIEIEATSCNSTDDKGFPDDALVRRPFYSNSRRAARNSRRRLRSSGRPHSPWQNGHAERLIGSIGCECLDHVVVFRRAAPAWVLKACRAYYKPVRTHLLDKEAPNFSRSRTVGRILAIPILDGLHHQYIRV